MKRLFADTYFYLAVVNVRERDHDAALGYLESAECEFVTTAWVLSEVAASLAPARLRAGFVELYEELKADPGFTTYSCHPIQPKVYLPGLELFGKRLIGTKIGHPSLIVFRLSLWARRDSAKP